jgi:hypothetical protein
VPTGAGADSGRTVDLTRVSARGYPLARMNKRDSGSAVRLVLIVLALLLVGGHDCVLPLPAGAEPAGHHHHGDSDHDTGAVHAADCEAVGLKASAPYSPSAAGTLTVFVRATADRPSISQPDRVPFDRPPRFLLHAALLI